MAFDIFKTVTDRIIDELEKGCVPWQKPWVSSGSCISHNDGRHDSLLNCMLLGQAGEYATFNQIVNVGGKIKKGSKAKMVVFWKPMTKAKKDSQGNVVLKPDGTPEQETYFILKYYNVFRIGSDTEGVSLKYTDPVKLPNTVKPNEKAERILNAYLHGAGVVVHHDGSQAFYDPVHDSITIPPVEAFYSSDGVDGPGLYHSVLAHEATHSTGHRCR